jgi:hypothetical protein
MASNFDTRAIRRRRLATERTKVELQRAALLRLGTQHELNDEQLGTLRFHATHMGGGYRRTLRAENELLVMGLLERRFGGLLPTIQGKPLLLVEKHNFYDENSR